MTLRQKFYWTTGISLFFGALLFASLIFDWPTWSQWVIGLTYLFLTIRVEVLYSKLSEIV